MFTIPANVSSLGRGIRLPRPREISVTTAISEIGGFSCGTRAELFSDNSSGFFFLQNHWIFSAKVRYSKVETVIWHGCNDKYELQVAFLLTRLSRL